MQVNARVRYSSARIQARVVMGAVMLVLLSGVAYTAAADQFTIRSGVAAGDDSGAVFLVGGEGFSLLFGADSTGSVSNLGVVFCTEGPCNPATVDFNRVFTGLLGFGSGQIGGVRYDGVAFDGQITITGGLPSVRTRSDGWTVSEAPFFLAALLNGSTLGGTPLFSHTLIGRGRAQVLFPSSGGLDGARLTFENAAPIPEPSTLTLFALGAAALVRARGRRRQSD